MIGRRQGRAPCPTSRNPCGEALVRRRRRGHLGGSNRRRCSCRPKGRRRGCGPLSRHRCRWGKAGGNPHRDLVRRSGRHRQDRARGPRPRSRPRGRPRDGRRRARRRRPGRHRRVANRRLDRRPGGRRGWAGVVYGGGGLRTGRRDRTTGELRLSRRALGRRRGCGSDPGSLHVAARGGQAEKAEAVKPRGEEEERNGASRRHLLHVAQPIEPAPELSESVHGNTPATVGAILVIALGRIQDSPLR